ncbi:MAG TPA: fibronectin type III domain-containing protein, partial [Acidimicrobiales bacterium]|nr:fibronectin type III domain-containing protein [Acidimicrobiales bacterium]
MTGRPDSPRRGPWRSDLGQTAIVAVLAVTLIIAIIGATLVAAVVQSAPLQQTVAVAVYAHRALQAGENAYLTAVNANPSLAQCNVNTNGAGTCSGINYGQWNLVSGSDSNDSYAEYYAFGNPQPTFDPTTHALTNLAIQVVGAAHSPSATNHYFFNSETMNLAATNGFLTNVWWSNFESYNPNGNYSNCNYNWKLNYNIDGGGSGCSPVYFGPGDYLFGPVFTNDSIFVSGNGSASGSPSFGNPTPSPMVPSDVHTADPNCQFVTDSYGMSGIRGGSTAAQTCAPASGAVYLYANSSNTTGSLPVSTYNHAVEPPPQSNAQLGTIASENGCLYEGPTQITLTTDASGKGEMTVVSPDTPVSPATVNGQSITRSDDNVAANNNDCPNDGTAYLPANGVVYVQNATAADTVAGANPFDDLVNNSVTNLTSNPASPVAGSPVTLTATVTSASSKIATNATVTFSQTTDQQTWVCNWRGRNCRWVTQSSTDPIPGCTGLSGWSAPVKVGSYWQATVTCSTTESSNGTGAFSATYSGGDVTSSSQGNLGQTNTLLPSVSYGAKSQTNDGNCSNCYFGEKGTPDAEGDAFVNGNLSGVLTIGTANNVIVDGDITYADCSGRWTTGQSGATDFCPYNIGGTNDSLGLIANNYVEVNHPISKSTGAVLPSCAGTPGALCDPSTASGGVTIDAAILALTQSFVVNNYQYGSNEGKLNVYGSIQQNARGPVGTFDPYTFTAASGYTKHYTWNPLLDYISPPSYLVPSTAPWTLTSVNGNGGQHGTSVCPVLTGVYDGTPSPAPMTQYCSQATGGLPGYPAITAPSPPTDVHATANAGGLATVSWTDPSDNGGPIRHYDVHPSPACSTCSGMDVAGPTATSASLSGLVPGVSYVFTVTATNDYGTSDPSAPSSSVATPNAPYAPTLVTAVGNINDSVAVSWTDPASPSGPITGYTVTPSPACPACTGLTQSGATATSTTINGLTPGGTYTFTVTASNANGTGPASAPSNAVVVPTKPGAPVNVTATSYASGQSVVSWSAPPFTGGLSISGYTVTSSPGGRTCTTNGITSCTVTGLANGTAYTFTVTATNALGTGPASAPSPSVTPSTFPGAPTIGTATAGNGSASVTFTAPASNGGAPITGYTVTSSPGGITATCASSPCTVTGLTNGTTYTFTVTATNGTGAGPASASSNSVTPSGPPGPPRSVAATSYANAQSVVTWTAPANNGGSAITKYTVTSSGGQTCTTPNGTTTSCTVTGLTNGTTYTFTVTATNGLGTGTPSSPASATPATAPGAPTGATAVRGYTQATVSWTAPVATGGLPVTSYTVTSSPGGRTCTTASTSCTVTGLTNGTAYTFTVTATNAAGTGLASAPSNSVTPSNTVPGAPTGVAATSFANTQSVVTWTAAAANGSAISKYTVTSSGGQTCTTTGATSCTVTGLTNGTAYTFTVTATNGLGTGPASSPSAPATPSTIPGAPTGVAATSLGNAQSVVSWTAPASNGGAPITSYTVTSTPGTKTCTTSSTSCTVTGL